MVSEAFPYQDKQGDDQILYAEREVRNSMAEIELTGLSLKGVSFAGKPEEDAQVKIVLEGRADESTLKLARYTGQPVRVTITPAQLSFEDARRSVNGG